ncbi:protein OS-9 [Aspergillus indologenus CBS 114.80]|uniref:Endoplasmic reticulum lectin n=1 Tax=Aspergillus indologenus CBS 114.80 TaxID=1450541 RepID=A0A2V5HNA3_9EURO|nr:protein OS-9 [Aspergillus indologenus CBS 114.80]
MARQSRILTSLLVLAGVSFTVGASKKSFSVHDDLLAFPQFQVLFPDEYILEPQARELLEDHGSQSSFENPQGISGQKRSQVYLGLNNHDADEQDESPHSLDTGDYALEEMILGDQRYLCHIPQVQLDERANGTGNDTAEADEQKELARATDRGLELLREMEGKCMYYISGWWSYSFCYKEKVKQFHALPSGSGVPNYPPMEDPTTQSFVLGRFPLGGEEGAEEEDSFAHAGESTHKKATASTTDVAELQTKGGSRYLVQRLDGGTRCDLTGRRRKIEVQFHCHPQSTDRIGWIKETATCSYLMIIYTPRLCNDAVFLPPQQEEIHEIECRQILTPDQVSDWKSLREALIAQEHAEDAGLTQEPFSIVGDIEVGAQRLVGSEGKKIEKGRVASAGEEKVDIVAKRENGQVYQRTREELLKYDIDPDKLEDLKKGVDEMAEGKDWKLELITVNGERHLNVLLEEPEKAQVEDDQGPSVHVTSFGPSDDQYKLDKPGNEGADSKAATAEGAAEEPSEESDEPEKRPSSESDASETGSEEVFKDEL